MSKPFPPPCPDLMNEGWYTRCKLHLGRIEEPYAARLSFHPAKTLSSSENRCKARYNEHPITIPDKLRSNSDILHGLRCIQFNSNPVRPVVSNVMMSTIPEDDIQGTEYNTHPRKQVIRAHMLCIPCTPKKAISKPKKTRTKPNQTRTYFTQTKPTQKTKTQTSSKIEP